MSQVPEQLSYLASHEWAEQRPDGRVRVGISDQAQSLLGDMVFVELPELGTVLEKGQEVAVVESVKAASDVYSPVPGTVCAVNEAVLDAPELLNQSPYVEGWLYEVEAAADALDGLLDAATYAAQIAAEEH